MIVPDGASKHIEWTHQTGIPWTNQQRPVSAHSKIFRCQQLIQEHCPWSLVCFKHPGCLQKQSFTIRCA